MLPSPLGGTVVVPVGVPINVTVTVDVPAGVLLLVLPLPQPLTERIARLEPNANAITRNEPRAAIALRLRQPSSISAPNGNNHPATVLGGGVAVVMVSVTFCGAVFVPTKATVAGMKVHCVFTGRPEHAMLTPPTYPLIGASVKVALTEPGELTVRAVGWFANTYCGARMETTRVAEDDVAKPESPL